MAMLPCYIISFFLIITAFNAHRIAANEDSCSAIVLDARAYLAEQDEKLRFFHNNAAVNSFNYNINVTEENRQKMIAALEAKANYTKTLAIKLTSRGYDSVEEEDVKRQTNVLKDINFAALADEDFKELLNVITTMQSNYAAATVCSYANKSDCTFSLEPQIQERMAKSRDAKELYHYWQQWYDAAGTPMKSHFAKYVELSRKAAQLNHFKSYADNWIHYYDDPDFEENLEKVFKEILPFYKELHAYVRYHLNKYYGDEIVAKDGNIPMHLLGNMWGQSWENVMDLTIPYPEKQFVDYTAELRNQNYTVLNMFQLGDEFFQSLNMTKLPEIFWKKSLLEKPKDRTVVCHASAWDFFKIDDVRIKMCTEVSMHYFYVIHHELGHIQYYLQYQHQPVAFRGAPNPGFHEAIGDLMALSVSTPKHLTKIGIIKDSASEPDEKSRINGLFKTAMKKIVFLPFAYTMDKYRYAVFRDELKKENWNCGFWRMRSKYSGIETPMKRTEEDFDPPAKYHIDADVEYLRYFASHIFQFQFLKAMCLRAGQYVEGNSQLPLDNCDFHGSTEAGAALKEMLSLGGSKHWKEGLKNFTGESDMNPAALLEYFEPLRVWIENENKRLNVTIGWKETEKTSKCE